MTKTKLLQTMAVLLVSLTTLAQEKGMKFFEGNWNELLTEAKRTGKPIFVDVYTVWCGPCKLMAKNIFPLEKVGDKYNEGFINYKLDAEKGDGPEVADRFSVSSYPTYLYLNSEGELVYRGGGYSGTPEPFMADADRALEAVKDPNTIGKMQASYKAGERSIEFLTKYISKLTALEMDNAEAMQEYFARLAEADKSGSEVIRFIAENEKDASTPAFAHLMQNLDLFRSLKQDTKGKHGFIYPLEYRIANTLQMSAMKMKEQKQYDKLITIIGYTEKLPVNQPYLVKEFRKMKMDYFGATGRNDSLMAALNEFVKPVEPLSVQEIRKENDKDFALWYEPYKTGKADSSKDDSFAKTRAYFSRRYLIEIVSDLNAAASVADLYVKDKKMMKRALAWNEKAIELEPDMGYLHLASAGLMNKMGNRKKARARIQSLLSIARTAGDQRSAELYENYLENLK